MELRMDSTRVTERQANELATRVAPMVGYLTRLYDRMQKRGWAGDDVLFEDVRRAQEATHRLHVTLREVARLQAARGDGGVQGGAARRPWEPGGAGRDA